MKRVTYSLTAQTPIFTGSDEKSGTIKMLRRESRLLPKPIEIQSAFANEQERRLAALHILFGVYDNISPQLKADNYGYYDAFAGKVKAAAKAPTKYAFLTMLCEMCDIDTIKNEHLDAIVNMLDMFDDSELLHTIKEEHQYLMMLVRQTAQRKTPLLSVERAVSGYTFKKAEDRIPYISGNSVRGLYRRLLMYDYCKQLGILKVDEDSYHTLFTGGIIFSNKEKKDKSEEMDSKQLAPKGKNNGLKLTAGVEDIGARRLIKDLCPPLAVLGSAIGSQTIEGAVNFIGPRLRCAENGTGEVSYWSLIENKFKTRLDSSKNEAVLELVNSGTQAKSGKGKDIKTQMLMVSEKFITGSQFDAAFVLKLDDPLIESCFWRGIELFKEYGFIGGEIGSDSGSIDMHIDIPAGASDLYLQHLKDKREEILGDVMFEDNLKQQVFKMLN